MTKLRLKYKTTVTPKNQLRQLINEPTRSTRTSNALTDLIITSTPGLFTSTGVIKSTISDQFPIYGVLCSTNNENRNEQNINSN